MFFLIHSAAHWCWSVTWLDLSSTLANGLTFYIRWWQQTVLFHASNTVYGDYCNLLWYWCKWPFSIETKVSLRLILLSTIIINIIFFKIIRNCLFLVYQEHRLRFQELENCHQRRPGLAFSILIDTDTSASSLIITVSEFFLRRLL